jgi:AmmeMemoRadiSam system protein A
MSPEITAFGSLTATERRDLLWLARERIRCSLCGENPPLIKQLTPAMCEPSAAFVSLHQQEELRGCIGTLAADRPLHETVAQLAVSAAFEDPRFPPISLAELAETEIEISRLSRLVRAAPEQICVERHGVYITLGEQRGVFLPQVARRFGWDRNRLLEELCHKALLPADAWRHAQASLMIFEAEIFSEADLGEA